MKEMSGNDQKLLQPYSVSRAVYRCDSTERKILYYASLLVQLKPYKFLEYDMQGYLAEFKISEMLLALGMANTYTNRKLVRKAVETIAKNTIKVVDTEKKLGVLNWLQLGIYDDEKDKVTLIFTDAIGKLFVECREKFSLINLKTIGGLKSYYAMRYYEIALSYRGYMGKCENPIKTWYFERSIDELRAMFLVDGYGDNRSNNFIDFVVKQPIAELNKLNSDFTITVEKLKNPLDRRRVVGFKFTCNVCKFAETTAKTELATKSVSTKKKKQKETENPELQEEIPEKKQEQERTKGLERELVDLKDQNAVLAEGNELLSKMTKLQMKYPKEFYERLTERQKKRKPFDFDILIFKEIVDSMIADGFF